jgi:hypothetical protein
MSLYLQLSKLGPAAGTTSSAALAKLARAAAAADDADAILVLQKQLPGELVVKSVCSFGNMAQALPVSGVGLSTRLAGVFKPSQRWYIAASVLCKCV